VVACIVEGPLPFPPGCTPAAGAPANGNGNGAAAPPPAGQALTHEQGLELLATIGGVAIQTVGGLIPLIGRDQQGNLIGADGNKYPPRTQMYRDEPKKEWFENPAVQIGGVVVIGLLLFGLMRN